LRLNFITKEPKTIKLYVILSGVINKLWSYRKTIGKGRANNIWRSHQIQKQLSRSKIIMEKL